MIIYKPLDVTGFQELVNRNQIKKIFLFVFICLINIVNLSAQTTKFHLIKTFSIQGEGGWDYISIGPGNNRLYVSHGTEVNIIDQETGDSLGMIPNTMGVHGIAFEKSTSKGFTSNGRLNSVTVFDLQTNNVLGQIPCGQNPDAIFYEPFSKKIITCNGRGKNLSLIDPVEMKTIDSIEVGGKPEAAIADGKGRLFVNIEDKNEIAVVDLKRMKVVAHWSLSPAEEPTGLAFDSTTNRLFAGCGNKLLAVVDATNGKLLQTLEIGDGCDGVGFDSGTKDVFASNGEGSLSIFHETPMGKLEPMASIASKRGARTIAVDSQKHLIYLPTAMFEKADPNAPNERPKTLPGTFQVLVIGE